MGTGPFFFIQAGVEWIGYGYHSPFSAVLIAFIAKAEWLVRLSAVRQPTPLPISGNALG